MIANRSSRCCWMLPALLMVFAVEEQETRAAALPHDYGRVELIRDQWGIPHVFADTDAGAMYGLGFASAADRGFQMHYTLRIIQGRLAEVIGNVPHVRRQRDTAVTSDRKMRTFGFARAAGRRVQELDAESLALLQAYAAGVNDYFQEHRDSLHPLFAEVGLQPELWTPADSLLSWWHLAQFFATDGTRDLISYRNSMARSMGQGRGRQAPRGRGRGAGRAFPSPPADVKPVPQDDAAAVVQRDDVSAEWIERTLQFLEDHGHHAAREAPSEGAPGPKFSHAWVADGDYSRTGGAVLVSMPQTPVANPSLLYEFHIHGQTFNARGAGVAGSPVILIGWNENVAWGMTALGADQADLFRLKTDDKHPDQYQFDSQWRKMDVIHEEIKVKGGRTQPIVVRETHFGPIANEFAFANPADPLVALKRIPICDTGRDTIQGAMAMMRATNVGEFLEGLKGWRFPTANVLFGDNKGEIGYSVTGALPLRSANALDNGGAAQEGSESANQWRTILPPELAPHVVNPKQGYLFSGNHRPIGDFYKIPLGIRTGSMGDSVRSWRLRQLFAQKDSMSADELRDLIQDSTNPARRAFVRLGYHVRDVLKHELSEETEKALKHLELWFADGSPSRFDVEGAALASLINTQFRFINTDLAFIYGGGDSGLSHFLKAAGKRLDEDPEADVTDREHEYIDRLLKDAWLQARRQYGSDPDQWDAIAQQQVADRILPYYSSLDGFPSLDPGHDLSMPLLPCVDGATVFSQAAQAYVQWVPLADVDKAQSLLPPGPVEAPGDRLRTVNVDDWVNGTLHPAPLSLQAVEAIAVSRQQLN